MSGMRPEYPGRPGEDGNWPDEPHRDYPDEIPPDEQGVTIFLIVFNAPHEKEQGVRKGHGFWKNFPDLKIPRRRGRYWVVGERAGKLVVFPYKEARYEGLEYPRIPAHHPALRGILDSWDAASHSGGPRQKSSLPIVEVPDNKLGYKEQDALIALANELKELNELEIDQRSDLEQSLAQRKDFDKNQAHRFELEGKLAQKLGAATLR